MLTQPQHNLVRYPVVLFREMKVLSFPFFLRIEKNVFARSMPPYHISDVMLMCSSKATTSSSGSDVCVCSNPL